jgi:hypothetical protein
LIDFARFVRAAYAPERVRVAKQRLFVAGVALDRSTIFVNRLVYRARSLKRFGEQPVRLSVRRLKAYGRAQTRNRLSRSAFGQKSFSLRQPFFNCALLVVR